jgi:hypothetical protein
LLGATPIKGSSPVGSNGMGPASGKAPSFAEVATTRVVKRLVSGVDGYLLLAPCSSLKRRSRRLPNIVDPLSQCEGVVAQSTFPARAVARAGKAVDALRRQLRMIATAMLVEEQLSGGCSAEEASKNAAR